ncbi:hypothetical protein B0H14DRAFT_2579450 [Mycena olivaceomarginata]|nr:hypothetical protein B0H14DRAFT_2579450 [Mycena olivaceomarginata]
MIDEIAGSYRKRAQWSFVVNIPGTYNGDMFAFAKKTKRWKYEGMSLRAVAKKHGFLKMGGRRPPRDERISSTGFSPGGLFQFVDNGFRTQQELAIQDPVEYKLVMERKDLRWKKWAETLLVRLKSSCRFIDSIGSGGKRHGH